MKKKFDFSAFTLAEILITLGIIGVVAALTIPALINNSQKTQYVTRLKKAYTELNQALLLMANDYSCIGDLVCTGLFAASTTDDTLGKKLVQYFKIAKDCGVAFGQGCFSDKTNDYFDGSSSNDMNYDNQPYYKFITADGISFLIRSYAPLGGGMENCGVNGGSGTMAKTCGFAYIDVNGPKGPNAFGKDFFMLFITNGTGNFVYPAGGKDDSAVGWWNSNNYCSASGPATNKYGAYCAGRIIEKGWDMDY